MTSYADPRFDRDLHALYMDEAPSVTLTEETRAALEALATWNLYGAALLMDDLVEVVYARHLHWYSTWGLSREGMTELWYRHVGAALRRCELLAKPPPAREYLRHVRYLFETLEAGTNNVRATEAVKTALDKLLDRLCFPEGPTA